MPIILDVRFEVFMPKIHVKIFWLVSRWCVVVGYQSFGRLCLTLKMEVAQTSEMLVSYHNTTWSHNPEVGGSMDLWKVGILPQRYMTTQAIRWRQHGSLKRQHPTTTLHASQPRKFRLEFSPPWNSQNSNLPLWHNSPADRLINEDMLQGKVVPMLN